MGQKVLQVKFQGKNLDIKFRKYESNDRTAIELVMNKKSKYAGEPWAMATLNMPGYYPPLGHVIIKNYSENEGMLEALVEAKIIAPPKIHVQISDFVKAPVCMLLVEPTFEG